MEIITDFRNDLLKRREIEASLEADSNPGFEFVKEKLSEELKVAADNLVVRAVRGKFGSNEFLVETFVYDTVEDLKKIEPKQKIKAEAK